MIRRSDRPLFAVLVVLLLAIIAGLGWVMMQAMDPSEAQNATPVPGEEVVEVQAEEPGVTELPQGEEPEVTEEPQESVLPIEVGITEVLPAEGAEMVGLNPAIMVRFEKPIVEADLLGNQLELPQPIELDPPALGVGQWLAPDFYGFYPSEPLNTGTEYNVLLNSLVAPGMELSEGYNWSFVTQGGQVGASFPYDGAEEVSRSTDVRVSFAQPMDRASTQENFKMRDKETEQPVAGEFVWEDDSTLLFVPKTRLQESSEYEIELSTEARSKGGSRGLMSPYRATFTTVDFLAVESVQPAPDTIEVTLKKGTIAVQFNHPVVQLVGLADKEELAIPFSLAPPLAGEGEWVTTSLFVYRPTEALAPSTEYVVTVSDELQDTVGSTLSEPYSWSFITEYPRVLRVEPTGRLGPPSDEFYSSEETPEESRALTVAPNGPIGLRFNQPMEPKSTEAAFRLVGAPLAGAPTAGGFEWQEDGVLLQFFPDTPLASGVPYQIVLAAGAQGAVGGETRDAFELEVTGAPPPEVIKSDPVAGEQEVEPTSNINLYFNTELNIRDIEQYIDIQPAVGKISTSFYSSSLQLNIWFNDNFASETSYTVTIDGQLSDKSGQTMGEDYVLTFTTGKLRPRLLLAKAPSANLGTFNPAAEPLQLIDYLNISQVDLELYRLTEEDILRVFESSERYDYPGNPAALVASWSIEPEEKPDVSSLARAILPLEEDEKKGLYVLTAISPNEVDPWSERALSDKIMLLFTPVNLTVKQTPDELVIWATSMESGQPLSNIEIHVIIDGEERSTIGTGQTDAEGIYRYSLPLLDEVNARFLVTSYDGEGTITGMARPSWTGTAGAWEFGYSVDTNPLTLYGNLYSERPIYRPGHTVYYKGVLRERDGRAFSLPTLQSMTVSLKSYGPEPAIREATVTLSPFGTFHGAFELPDDLEPATYRLVLEQEEIGFCTPDYCNYETVETLIQVAEYQRPEFEVIVESEQNAVVQGESATANVAANYYSGGALTEADVSWRQYSRPYYFRVPILTGYWNWWDNDRVDNFPVSLSQSGTTRLGSSGEATIELQTLPEVDEESEEEQLDRLPISQRVTIEADVEDINGEVISGEAEMIVHVGEFYIGLNPDSYVGRANQPFIINVATANRAGVLERGHDVTLEFSKREWGSQRASFGLGWERIFTDTLITTDSTVTDDNGRATLSFTPSEGGSYTVVAIGQDGQGNAIRSRSYFWVTAASGSVVWGVTQDDRIELAADKDTYQVGDVARILVPTPLEGMTALISEEQLTMGELSIRTLAGTAEVIEIPITADMIPNTYINVVAVSGTSAERPAPEFGMGYVKLSVSAEPNVLNIEVTPQRSPDAGAPQPGEEVDFKIRISDAADQPVAAEVSFAMVDKAVLSLAEVEQKTLFDSFYSQRPLAVQTGSSYTINIDRINETFAAAQEGGGGGGGGGGGPSAVRSEILDTAYWKADLLTDKNGEVAVTIKLPDNLTTWTMIAKAVTKEGPFVGQQQDDLIATKPLIVRPSMPRFLVVGDSLELPVLVQNNTEQGINTLVSIEVGRGLAQATSHERIAIGPNGRGVVYFPITVQEEGPTDILVQAQGGGFEDALFQELPIYHPTSPEVVASSSIIRQGEGAALESIQLPEGTNPKQGELTIELAPSLAGATEKTLDWLKSYPYAHTEAVTSRLLANAANLKALRLMESERPELQQKLENEVSDALSLLAPSQNSDGGWSWWPGNQSQPWLTAYLLFSVNEAQQAGMDSTVNTTAAREYLQAWLTETENTQEEDTLQTQTFVVYVLSESQNAELAPTLLTHAERLFEKRPLLPAIHAARAYLLLTFTNLGNEQQKVDTLASELTSSVHITATGAQWQEEAGSTFDSSLRTTAQALRALLRAQPEHLLIQQSVRWLMNARHNDSWGSTLDSAYAILALTDYIQQSGELDANFAYEVSLNGEVIIREQATSDNLTTPVSVEVSLTDLLLDQANKLIITQLPPAEGEAAQGRLYYSTWLRTFLPISTLAARSEGIDVSRQYEFVDPITQISTGGLIDSATVGDIVQVRLRIEAPHDLPYFTLESPIPAGTEILDPSLATTASEAIANQKGIERETNPFFYEFWSQEFVRDEKVVLFSNSLPRGTYEYIYWIRATLPGEFNLMPTLAYESYHPELFGRSEGGIFIVTEESKE